MTIATETHSTAAAATDERAEQIALLRNSAADFVAGSTDHKRTRALRNRLPGYDAGLLRQMGELGWFGVLVPEAHGGLGLGLGEMAVVLHELGKGLLAEPLTATVVLAGRAIEYSDNDTLKGELLGALAEGRLRAALAWQEQEGGLELMPRHTRVTGGAAGLRITGRKRFVNGAADAKGFVVSALDGAQAGLYWVDAGARGVQLAQEWRADGTPSTVLTMDDVPVQADHVLNAPGPATLAVLDRVIDQACVMASAEMLGVIEATMAMTLDYMRNRVQFGKAIGSFQALQHKAVDLYIQQELTRAVLSDAVRTLDDAVDPQECSRIASRCKARASDAGLRVTREAIQLHGAIGFTDEYDLGLYVKRALVLSAWLGNASAHRRRFAALNATQWGE